LLTVIDTISKYGWGEVIKSKNAGEVTKAMETRKEVNFGKPKLVYPCSYIY